MYIIIKNTPVKDAKMIYSNLAIALCTLIIYTGTLVITLDQNNSAQKRNYNSAFRAEMESKDEPIINSSASFSKPDTSVINP
ncbi:MAG: hypothetical protein IT223_04290 [Crocinitomicaceae bacterium]|nr:hypothetical protein [Crocinitomicaceae bacterium]